MESSAKPVVKISNYTIVRTRSGEALIGKLASGGHPRLAEGTIAQTSRILSKDKPGFIETLNTIYELVGEEVTFAEATDGI